MFYNVSRGHLSTLSTSLGSCFATGLPKTTFSIDDPSIPAVGDGFTYLVSRTAAGSEGSVGLKSDGRDRLIDTPCP